MDSSQSLIVNEIGWFKPTLWPIPDRHTWPAWAQECWRRGG